MLLPVLLVLALLPAEAAAAPASAAPPPANAQKPPCDRFARVDRAQGPLIQRGAAPGARRLDELPPGDLILAVERQMNGCREPVIVRQNIGR